METEKISIPNQSPQVEKLDRLRTTAIIRLTLFGIRIGIRATAKGLLDRLISRVPGWKKTTSTSVERLYSVVDGCAARSVGDRGHCYSILADGRMLVARANWEELCEAFDSDLEFFIASRSRKLLFVHAGVVSWRGQAIVIPGPSKSGKTTLVRALLGAGASYYSDEFALIDSAGSVHPFPRPLAIRENGSITRIAAAQLGAPQATACARIARVILTRYAHGIQWCPRVLSHGQGILGILQNTVAALRYPELVLTALQRAIPQAHVLGGMRGEAEEAASLILRDLNLET
jgi:hypothetical protein